MLARCGVMTELDAGALARYAVIWCRWIDAEAEIKRQGSDRRRPRPATSSTARFSRSPTAAMRQLAQLESEFGLTPSSRSRVRAASPPRETDPLAAQFFDS